ncbi:NAD(P)-dependent oxidoreductase [Trinickia caryophylli]|uniref:Uronate dehydrogenase n=1 Tax=Trinickia caryophylli TaxID=28094 RepID=A0A1X7H2F0_TRICW|nr:NAD(P)-dependent oxidoreductase [Trinickia caryophylli]PMS09954.1 NAD(P)-dependent oxidoreductase [Trinickia caryophylli]TRX18304.1 NAD(P)-dependent oxidoreductase [Trinickia caryophylli]WQE10913.1 NAD(P)-dependent oxidoreductase [Trinickia caryophylli]SMF77726.1 uronate dehydrogenase [Trinickia caryophylli]GLU35565.1 uronate dehydrogenase [Trinickia caryophylli]
MTTDIQMAADPLDGISVRCGRILLTGAAGNLGRVLRERLTRYCDVLRSSDLAPLAELGEREESMPCNLADAKAVDALVRGCDAIVHLGGVSVERPFEEILPANIEGTYHLYEAARRHGVKRIVFASSNHVTGFYRQDEVIGPEDPPRPDGYYGISKAFGEQLARFYFDRYGIETVSIRIGSSFPEPKDRRMLTTWLGYDDLEQLVRRAMFVPNVGCLVVYGVSANRDWWWNNDAAAAKLGYVPAQTSEPWRARIENQQAPLPETDPVRRYQGGGFVVAGPFGD